MGLGVEVPEDLLVGVRDAARVVEGSGKAKLFDPLFKRLRVDDRAVSAQDAAPLRDDRLALLVRHGRRKDEERFVLRELVDGQERRAHPPERGQDRLVQELDDRVFVPQVLDLGPFAV